MENDKKDSQNIELEQETIRTPGIDLEEKVKLIKQELMEMKSRMARFEMVSQGH